MTFKEKFLFNHIRCKGDYFSHPLRVVDIHNEGLATLVTLEGRWTCGPIRFKLEDKCALDRFDSENEVV